MAVNLPWSTTYNCAEWNQDQGEPTCDGLARHGVWKAYPSGYVSSGSTTTLVDTSVNFVTGGIQIGDILYYIEGQTWVWNTPITSISTTTNPNDTLNFATQSTAPSNNGVLNNYTISPQDTSLKKLEQITTGANNPSGGGGRGQRHWLADGENHNSGGLAITLTSGQTELWIRWYMRFQTGFKWVNYSGYKILYFMYTGVGSVANVFLVGVYGSTNFSYIAGYGEGINRYNYDAGWSQTFCGGGVESDGSWHSIELHIKSETGAAPNNTDGILQWWVDGVLKGNFNTIDHGLNSLGLTIDYMLIGSNAKYPDNGLLPYYVDYDDIAVSNTGYIGPLGATPPSPPTNLRII